jgi:hypothetical protein
MAYLPASAWARGPATDGRATFSACDRLPPGPKSAQQSPVAPGRRSPLICIRRLAGRFAGTKPPSLPPPPNPSSISSVSSASLARKGGGGRSALGRRSADGRQGAAPWPARGRGLLLPSSLLPPLSCLTRIRGTRGGFHRDGTGSKRRSTRGRRSTGDGRDERRWPKAAADSLLFFLFFPSLL